MCRAEAKVVVHGGWVVHNQIPLVCAIKFAADYRNRNQQYSSTHGCTMEQSVHISKVHCIFLSVFPVLFCYIPIFSLTSYLLIPVSRLGRGLPPYDLHNSCRLCRSVAAATSICRIAGLWPYLGFESSLAYHR
jgi:hypothetical protein